MFRTFWMRHVHQRRLRNWPRLIELEQEISRFFQTRLTLWPTLNKGGSDEVLRACDLSGRCLAVLRVNGPFRKQSARLRSGSPRQPLEPRQRLHREWCAYARLSENGLAPRPLWRAEDAIATAWLSWERASDVMRRGGEGFWTILERLLRAAHHMHELDVVHLDLNPANVLLESDGDGVAFIDFEDGPAPWVTFHQQIGFDYVYLLSRMAKRSRGGPQMEAEAGRLVDLLQRFTDPRAHAADLKFAGRILKSLPRRRRMWAAMQYVFQGL